MTEERFFQILEAYGADPSRWPEAERAAAQAFAAAHPRQVEAAMLAEARLDVLLRPAATEVPDLLEHRILRSFPVPVAAPRWQIPAAAAAALLAGVLIGFASGVLTAGEPAPDTVYADAFSSLDEDWTAWLGEDA
jgi:hypothetical protein